MNIRKILIPILLIAPFISGSPTLAQLRDNWDFFQRGRADLERNIRELQNQQSELENPLIIDTQAQWKDFDSKSGSFTVQMPINPRELSSNLETANGNISLKGFIILRYPQLFVAAGDYPQAAQGDAESILGDLQNRLVKDLQQLKKVNFKEDKAITLNQFKGREVTLSNDTEVLTFRLYLINQKVYVLGVSQKNNNVNPQVVARFFDSFKLTF